MGRLNCSEGKGYTFESCRGAPVFSRTCSNQRVFAQRAAKQWVSVSADDLMKRNAEALNVCPLCIGNQVFSQFVVTHGAPGKCGFNRSHGKKKTVVSVEAFAEYVDDWFRENYGRGEEYPVFEGDSDSPTYETRGEPYKYILADELECDDAVVEAISENLPDADWHDISQGDQAFYDDTANYESFAAAQARSTADDYWYESQFTYQWDDFCRAVQYERRFFRIKEQLDELFGKPEEYSAGQTTPVYILRKGAVLYRGRILDDRFTEDQLSAAPAISLGRLRQTERLRGE